MLMHWLFVVALTTGLTGARQEAISPLVTIAVSVADAEVCTVDKDFVRVRLNLSVRVRNVATNPAILPARLGMVHYDRAAETLSALGTTGWKHYGWISSNDRPVFGERPDARFVVLPKGRDHSAATAVDLFMHRDLLSERLFFQLVFGGLDLDSKDERALRSRWQKFGTLYAGSIRTEPFPATLPPSRVFRACEGTV